MINTLTHFAFIWIRQNAYNTRSYNRTL